MTTFLPMMYAVSILCGYHHWEVDQISCRMNLVHCARARAGAEVVERQRRFDADTAAYNKCAAKALVTMQDAHRMVSTCNNPANDWVYVTHTADYFVADCAKELKIPGADQ